MGEAFFYNGAAKYIPILFKAFYQEKSVPAIVNAWIGVGCFFDDQQDFARERFALALDEKSALSNPVFYEYAALSHFMLEQWPQVIGYYNKFFEKVSPSANLRSSHMIMGHAYYMLNDYVKAIEWHEKAFQHEKGLLASDNDITYLREAGQSCLMTNQLAKAGEYFEYILQSRTNIDFQDYLNLGLAYFKQGKNLEALKQYEQAIHKNPNIPNQVYFSAAQLALSLEDWKKAAELYKEGLKKSTTPDLMVYTNLGTAYFNLEKWDEASFYLNRAILLKNEIAVNIYERAVYANAKVWEIRGKNDSHLLELKAIYLVNILNNYQSSIEELGTKELAAPLGEILKFPEITEAVNKLRQ